MALDVAHLPCVPLEQALPTPPPSRAPLLRLRVDDDKPPSRRRNVFIDIVTGKAAQNAPSALILLCEPKPELDSATLRSA